MTLRDPAFAPLPDGDALDRYLAGQTASHEESVAVRAALATVPEAEATLKALGTLHAEACGDEPAVDAMWQAVQARIETESMSSRMVAAVPFRTQSRRGAVRPMLDRRWGIALAAALVVGVGFVASTTYRRERADTPTAMHAVREYATQRGQRATVTLPDGSHAVLAPESHVRYGIDAHGARVVHLDGQAYFTVTHDPAHPFTVNTAATETRVLGTSFAVRAYASDETTQIAVAEGKVAVANVNTNAKANATDGPSVVLLPGEVGRLQAGEAPVVMREASLSEVFGWMRGQLTFDNAPLREVVAELRRTYDLDVRVADAATAQRRFSGAFAGESAATIVHALTLATGTRATWHGTPGASKHGTTITLTTP